MQLLIVACLAAVALTAQACQENAHYSSCGTACPLTCENYRNPPKACVLMCVEGCHCDDGYVLSKDGRCLLPDDCPATSNDGCGENQEFLTCGSACPLTCDNYEDRPIACTLQCVMGCHCKPGYVKTNDGRCVLPNECPKKQSGINILGSSPRCSKPLETGNCMAYFHRYGFNPQTGKCEKFVYGGCGGNDNNFETLEECRSTCLSEAQLRRPDCDMDADAGLCQAYLKRFYYADGECKEFVYGGCGGNRNNFKTEEECYNKCGALHAPTACSMEKVVGPCRAAFPRWHFNQQTNQCEEFIYGGCQGNSNNFNDREDCEAVCLAKTSPVAAPAICSQGKAEGPCKGDFKRYYFNQETKDCESFTYGGCKGNENNFLQKEDCRRACIGI